MDYRVCLSSDPFSEALLRHLTEKLAEADVQESANSPTAYVHLGALTTEAAHSINIRAFAQKRNLLALSLSSEVLRLGPVVVYGETPCLACWEVHTNLFPNNGYITKDDAGKYPSAQQIEGALPLMVDALLEYAHSRYSALQPGTIAYYSSVSGQFLRRVRTVRSPMCPICSVLADHAAESYLSYVG